MEAILIHTEVLNFRFRQSVTTRESFLQDINQNFKIKPILLKHLFFSYLE